jgi:hypothetical protein
MPVRCDCGKMTNNKDGICAPCSIFNKHLPEQRKEKLLSEKPKQQLLNISLVKGQLKKEEKPMAKKPCEVSGCPSKATKEGLCGTHYIEKHGEKPYPSYPDKKVKLKKVYMKKSKKKWLPPIQTTNIESTLLLCEQVTLMKTKEKLNGKIVEKYWSKNGVCLATTILPEAFITS